MEIEFEATFTDIDLSEFNKKLIGIGAQLIKKRYLQKRVVFNLPKGNEIAGGWLRVRDESGIVTMSLKSVDGDKIHNQKEIFLKIDSFDKATSFLKTIGCEQKAYQENYRELWKIGDVEITIDEWPFLEPYVEIEGNSEDDIHEVANKLGLDYSKAVFGAVDVLYAKKYNISNDRINNHTPKIVFDMENPFIDVK